ncbi:Uncharacterised protein [Cedecea neteri]|uniref:Uncharacterized protein n=1 Tax=Cedecea neteri TaxID=158822 RepID=A0A2X3J6P8_9ENTR|nr:Uncharacterised protein [Cedecea neteri]
MVDNDVVERVKVNLTLKVLHKLAAKLMVYGVDQDGFFFTDEIAVIAAAAQRFVFRAVKITHFPVTLPNPLNVVFNLNRPLRTSLML